MMDLFGNDFLVLYRYYEKYKTYIAERVIESKQDYLNYGFTKEQSMMQIEPISFFDEKEEVFNPKKEDFDINQNCLIHIIQERRERFPESIRSQSDSKIAGQIMNALERGIKMQRRDRSFAKASYSGKLSNVTRRLCRTLGVKIVEVKSTNIRNDLKVESDFTGDYDNVKSVQKLLETIRRKDDVFCYPKLKRRESDPGYCLDDYCREVQERFSEFDGCKGENLRRRVIAWECENQCCDIFVRVYLDRPAKKGFVIGWMQKEELLDDTVQFKRMRQKNKSELALYFAKNLGETKGIDCLAQAFGKPKQRVYANPYTPTNFYHKTDDCKFIRRVPKEELLIFDSEEAAIQNGRFINRCRECFSKDG